MAKLTIMKIEDFEDGGQCGECGRNGLRWVATLSDGTRVGLECAKKVLGFRPKPLAYNWIGDFEVVAEYTDFNEHYVMWQHKVNSRCTRETVNGSLVMVGGVRTEWARRGWS